MAGNQTVKKWGMQYRREKTHITHLLRLLEGHCSHFFSRIHIIPTFQKYPYFLGVTLPPNDKHIKTTQSSYVLIQLVSSQVFDHSYHTNKSVRKNKTRQSSIAFYHKVMSVLDFLANTTTLAHLSPDLLNNLETRTILGRVTSKAEISRKRLTYAPILKVTLIV